MSFIRNKYFGNNLINFKFIKPLLSSFFSLLLLQSLGVPIPRAESFQSQNKYFLDELSTVPLQKAGQQRLAKVVSEQHNQYAKVQLERGKRQ